MLENEERSTEEILASVELIVKLLCEGQQEQLAVLFESQPQLQQIYEDNKELIESKVVSSQSQLPFDLEQEQVEELRAQQYLQLLLSQDPKTQEGALNQDFLNSAHLIELLQSLQQGSQVPPELLQWIQQN